MCLKSFHSLFSIILYIIPNPIPYILSLSSASLYYMLYGIQRYYLFIVTNCYCHFNNDGNDLNEDLRLSLFFHRHTLYLKSIESFSDVGMGPAAGGGWLICGFLFRERFKTGFWLHEGWVWRQRQYILLSKGGGGVPLRPRALPCRVRLLMVSYRISALLFMMSSVSSWFTVCCLCHQHPPTRYDLVIQGSCIVHSSPTSHLSISTDYMKLWQCSKPKLSRPLQSPPLSPHKTMAGCEDTQRQKIWRRRGGDE